MHYTSTYDVITIGGGYAGTEAALAAARGGRRNAAADAQHQDHRADELQSGNRHNLHRGQWFNQVCGGEPPPYNIPATETW